jgi:hypothetical protein
VDRLAAAAINPIDVVLRMERMPSPRIAADISLAFDGESVEEHDRDVNAYFLRDRDPCAHAIEIGLAAWEARPVLFGRVRP